MGKFLKVLKVAGDVAEIIVASSIVVEYLGDYRFVAIKTENSTMRLGDTFRCLQIQKGRELHMDNFTRCNAHQSSSARYVVGRTNGISVAEFVTEKEEA